MQLNEESMKKINELFKNYLDAKEAYMKSPNDKHKSNFDNARSIILDNHPYVKSRTREYSFTLDDNSKVTIQMKQWDIAPRNALQKAGMNLKGVADPSGTAFAASPIVSECLHRGTHFVHVFVDNILIKSFFVLGAPKFSGMNEGDDDDDQNMTSEMFCCDGKSVSDCAFAMTTEKANGINGKGRIDVIKYNSGSFVLVSVGTKGTLTFFPLMANYDELYPEDLPKNCSELELLKKMTDDIGYQKLMSKVKSVVEPSVMKRELALAFQKWLRGLSTEKLMEFANLFRIGNYTSIVFEGLLPDDEHMVELPITHTIIAVFTFIDDKTSKPVDPQEAFSIFDDFELPVLESGIAPEDSDAVFFSTKREIVSADIFQDSVKRDKYLSERRKLRNTEGDVIYLYYHNECTNKLKFLGMFKVKATDYITFRFLRQRLLRSGKSGFGPIGYIRKSFSPKSKPFDINMLRTAFITAMRFCSQEINRLNYVGSWEVDHEVWVIRMIGFVWNYLLPLWNALVKSFGEMDGTKCFYYLFKTQYGTMISEFLASGCIEPEFPDRKWYEKEIQVESDNSKFNVNCVKYISRSQKSFDEEVVKHIGDLSTKTVEDINRLKELYKKRGNNCRKYVEYIKKLQKFVSEYNN